MKHSDPADSSRDSGPSHMNRGVAVPPNETLMNALRLHHQSVIRQDEARRRRQGGLLATPPQSPPSSSSPPRRIQDEDIYSPMSWLSSPHSVGYSYGSSRNPNLQHRHHHPGASPPTSMNGGWGGPTTSRSESAALQDTRRRHLLGILTAALDELSDGSMEMDPLDSETDLDE